MYFLRFAVMKLTLLSERIFLYIENELCISTEVVGTLVLHTRRFKL